MNRPGKSTRLPLLARRVAREFAGRGLRLATAESCTGGWIAKVATGLPGSSRWFDEGFVTYSNDAKRRSLGVKARTLSKHGAVSEAVVLEMARGAMAKSRADVSVSVSGIAGPDGATPGKPVGTVWFCWAWRSGGATRTCTLRRRFRGGRDAVRRASVAVALQGLLKLFQTESIR